MTKNDLAHQLAYEARFSMTVREATDIIETLCDLIVLHFQQQKDPVTLRGFGTMKLRKRVAFTGRNPKTGKGLPIAEKLSITFKPSAEFLRRINTKGE